MAIQITEADLHDHLKARMAQRGISMEELERTVNEGWTARDAKPGTQGKIFVFTYQDQWEGRRYEEKKVSVYYKGTGGTLVFLTLKAR